MEVNINHLFESLSKTAPQVNEASDSINTILAAFVERLDDLNLGIEVWLNDPLEQSASEGEPDNYTRIMVLLGYSKARDRGGWGLSIKEVEIKGYLNSYSGDVCEEIFNSKQSRCLMKASRNLRLASLDKLPGLLKSIDEKAKETVESIEKAKDALKK